MRISDVLILSFEQLGVFSSQVFQESPRDKIWKRKHCNFFFYTSYFLSLFYPCLGLILVLLIAAPMFDMEKHCNIEIAAQISRVPTQNGI